MTVFLLIVLFVLVIWLVFKTNRLDEKLTLTERRLDEKSSLAERRLWDLEHGLRPPRPAPEAAPSTAPATPPPLPSVLAEQVRPSPAPAVAVEAKPLSGPEVPPVIAPGPVHSPELIEPPPPAPLPPALQFTAPKPVNWEQFLGVKLFAWIAGLAMFLGAAFFLKVAFDEGWISPEVRVAMGYLVGFGLLVSGLALSRERYAVTVQTLCAAGTLILYASIFASHAYYRLITEPTVAFALMALVTVTAFRLAVRLDAPVVAILGLLGGFLTPPLLSTGVDRPFGLFGYIALLDVGLIAIAVRKRWHYLVLLAAAATVAMQASWVGQFFAVEKFYIALGIFLGFTILFVAALAVADRLRTMDRWSEAAAILMPSVALLFVFYLLVHPYPALARRVVLLFSFVFLVDLGFLAIAWLRDRLRPTQVVAGAGVFLLLAIWTVGYLSPSLLNAALGFFLLFAILHAVAPVALHRLRPASMPLGWIHAYPALALLLIMIPLFKLEATPFLVWPVVLLIDLVAIALAVLTASLVSILAVFVLTMLVTAFWIIQAPPALPEVPAMLLVIGTFGVFFMAAAIFAARKVFAREAGPESAGTGTPSGSLPSPQLYAQVASLGAVLPFLLLTMVVLRLPLANPSSVFGLAALLVVLFLGALRFVEADGLAAASLGSVLLLEYAWHLRHFTPEQTGLAIGWYLGFSAVFLVFPFLCQRRLEKRVMPWTVSALALPLHFFLIHRAVKLGCPDFAYKGLVPAGLAVPCLVGLLRLVRTLPVKTRHRNTLLALFGAATLFFITLVFPIQFERQWLTIAWALEGVALLWLLHRVPHEGLKLVGTALLAVAFVRLALNPAVLEYHVRSHTPILNWYLYAYGIVTVCLMAGARLLAPPRSRILDLNTPPVLYGLGTVLAFLLLNIEIADYFSTGTHLTFHFSSNLGQDMTYSLAWAVFAFVLLAVGFRVNSAAVRYAGMGLLVVTIIKLFLHDLFRLGGLYRVGSLVGLAVVLTMVSFIYQRFLSAAAIKKSQEGK